MTIALTCIGVLSLMIFGLGVVISLRRLLTQGFYSGAADPTSFTTKLSRAHGNTAEFAPTIALLCLMLSSREPSTWIEVAMIGATASRVLVVAGFPTSENLERMSLLKAGGALGTYGFGLALSVGLVLI